MEKFKKERNITDQDRFAILYQHVNGWHLGVTSRALAEERGLSINQVAAVCAWTTDNLGGRGYLAQYMNRPAKITDWVVEDLIYEFKIIHDKVYNPEKFGGPISTADMNLLVAVQEELSNRGYTLEQLIALPMPKVHAPVRTAPSEDTRDYICPTAKKCSAKICATISHGIPHKRNAGGLNCKGSGRCPGCVPVVE